MKSCLICSQAHADTQVSRASLHLLMEKGSAPNRSTMCWARLETMKLVLIHHFSFPISSIHIKYKNRHGYMNLQNLKAMASKSIMLAWAEQKPKLHSAGEKEMRRNKKEPKQSVLVKTAPKKGDVVRQTTNARKPSAKAITMMLSVRITTGTRKYM